MTPFSANATPMTYEYQGRQYVVIAAGGHSEAGTRQGDYVLAYALPRAGEPGLVAALEILVNTPGVANVIRQGKLDQLENAMQGGRRSGMITMDSALKDLLDKGVITGKAAYQASIEKRKFEDVKDRET